MVSPQPQSPQREIAADLIAGSGRAQTPLIVHIIAATFAKRLVQAQQGAGFLQLAAWSERTCERYGSLPNVAALLRSACGIARDTLCDSSAGGTSLRSDLNALEASILRALDAARPAEIEERRSDSVDESIAAFLIELDAADPLSAEHSRAVSLWCSRLARRLDLSDERRLFVMRGGMLHDIGKTSTPAEILLAPRALTNDEFATMREHAPAGAAMLTANQHLEAFAPLVRSHHERLDGKGYPDALPAEQISLDVRIVAVADCFNAMIGRRPYRPPMSPSLALEQLVKHSGTQFDPTIVEAMIDTVEHPEA